MNKFFNKLLVILMALLLAIMTGCGAGGEDDDERSGASITLNVITIDKGYGTAWLSALEKLFEDEHSDVNVKIKKEVIDQNVTKFLDSGAGNSDYDLYFSGNKLTGYIEQTMSGIDNVLVDISDIYGYRPNGDGTLSVEEILEGNGLLSAYKHEKDGNNVYYTLPWTQGINGLLVNFDVVNAALGKNWQETYPCRTTKELLDLCDALKAKNTYAFIYAAETKYYQFLYCAWWAQYEGLKAIDDFYTGTAYDPATQKYETPSKLILKQQGRLESMKVMESIMKEDYVNPISSGIAWDAMQTRFMAGQAAMLPNGDWNNIEMGRAFPTTSVRFIKTPVVSALGEKLGITETELANIISYIDAKQQGESVSVPSFNPTGEYSKEEVLSAVEEARSVVATYSDYHTVAIPTWSKNIELAKEFLRLMVSDRGQDAYAKATSGDTTTPFGYDISKSDWYNGASENAKARWQIARNAKYYFDNTDLPLGKAGLLAFRAIYQAPIEHLFYKRGFTAQQICDIDVDYYNSGNNWNSLLEMAGYME